MLKNLYGENTLDQMGRGKWVIADLQKWFSLTPCMGGRKRSQSDNAVGVKNAWMDLCANDEHACSLKELPNQLLVAGNGRLNCVALSAVSREDLTSDVAKVARAYIIRDVTYLIQCVVLLPPHFPSRRR